MHERFTYAGLNTHSRLFKSDPDFAKRLLGNQWFLYYPDGSSLPDNVVPQQVAYLMLQALEKLQRLLVDFIY